MGMRCLIFSILLIFLCSCDAVHEEEGWVGLTEVEIVDKLGKPSSIGTLELSSTPRLYEYQGGLYDHAPEENEEAVEILELHWWGLITNKAAWLRQHDDGNWVVFETLVWNIWVRF